MSKFVTTTSALALSTALALGASGAAAQTADQAGSGKDGVSLPELVVTAQRREENIQKTPVAVTAIGSEQLARQQINRVENLSASVPSLYVGQVTASPSAVAISLRGAEDVTGGLVTSESPVALYIDDVYQSRLQVANFDLADIERVEVLRGPQGTLYGRNSMTGAIKFITRQPDGRRWVTAEAAGGSYGRMAGKISVGDRLGPHAAGSLALSYSDTDGWQVNRATGQHVGKLKNWGVHVGFGLIDMGPLTVTVLGTHTETRSDGQHFTPMDANRKPVLGAFGSTQSPAPNRGDNDQSSVSVNVAYKLDHVTLKSITAYGHLNDYWGLDFGGGSYTFDPVPPRASFFRRSDAHDDQFTQEFQATGDFGETVHYIAGLFFFDEHAHQVLADTFGPLLFGPTPVSTLPESISIASKSYAAYGQVDYTPTDKLTLTAGIRYGRDKKSFRGSIQNGFAFPFTPAPVADTLNTTAATPKFSVQYKFTPDIMGYVTAARGYRSGSFNALVLADPVNFGRPFQPEYNWTFEAGEKAEFLDRRVRLNMAAYIEKLSNLQEAVNKNGSTFTENAAKATLTGVETEFSARLTPNLTLDATLTYTDSKYNHLDPTTTAYQFHAKVLPLVSKWQYQVSAIYEVRPAMLQGWGVRANADYSGRTAYFSEASDVEFGRIPELRRMNAALALISPDNRWTVAVEGKNITNRKEYFSCLAIIPGVASYCQPLPPAAWQVRVRYAY